MQEFKERFAVQEKKLVIFFHVVHFVLDFFDIRVRTSGQKRPKLSCSGHKATRVKEEEVYFE